MNEKLRMPVGVIGFSFFVMGALWLVQPEFVAKQLGMSLLHGVGLSTQIGDMASFFLTLGGCLLLGFRTRLAYWLYPPIMLLSFAASGRVLAWLFHGASLALEMIVVEAAVAAVLMAALKRTKMSTGEGSS
jgi:integral membrane sensor domain MASE1